MSLTQSHSPTHTQAPWPPPASTRDSTRCGGERSIGLDRLAGRPSRVDDNSQFSPAPHSHKRSSLQPFGTITKARKICSVSFIECSSSAADYSAPPLYIGSPKCLDRHGGIGRTRSCHFHYGDKEVLVSRASRLKLVTAAMRHGVGSLLQRAGRAGRAGRAERNQHSH